MAQNQIQRMAIHEKPPAPELQRSSLRGFLQALLGRDELGFVLHPSTERGIFTPDAGPDLTQRAQKHYHKLLMKPLLRTIRVCDRRYASQPSCAITAFMTRMRAMTFSCQRAQLEHAFAKKIAAPSMDRCQRHGDGVRKQLGSISQPNTDFPPNVHIQIEQNTIAPLPLTHGVVLTSTFFHTQQDNKANNMGISVCPIFSPYYFESLNK